MENVALLIYVYHAGANISESVHDDIILMFTHTNVLSLFMCVCVCVCVCVCMYIHTYIQCTYIIVVCVLCMI